LVSNAARDIRGDAETRSAPVGADARVIDQNINGAELRNQIFDDSGRAVRVGNIDSAHPHTIPIQRGQAASRRLTVLRIA
jgi:hypothetical protein